jgi:hypothetical protein
MANVWGYFRSASIVISVGLALFVAAASQAAGSPRSSSAARIGNGRPGAVLDPSFGNGGMVKLASKSTFEAYGAAIQGGTLLVSGGSSVQLLNNVGGTGEAFGNGRRISAQRFHH